MVWSMKATAVAAEPEVVWRRWPLTLTSVGLTSFLFINGVAFLIPLMVSVLRMSLVEAALLASMPSWGMVVTLILWGYVTDRFGERLVMTAGSALTAAAACCAAWVHSPFAMGAFLFVGGMAAASANTAGGSPVSGWFARDRGGLAMGIRHTAQPLGIALGALLPQHRSLRRCSQRRKTRSRGSCAGYFRCSQYRWCRSGARNSDQRAASVSLPARRRSP
jgi:sugar phosphate permease